MRKKKKITKEKKIKEKTNEKNLKIGKVDYYCRCKLTVLLAHADVVDCYTVNENPHTHTYMRVGV